MCIIIKKLKMNTTPLHETASAGTEAQGLIDSIKNMDVSGSATAFLQYLNNHFSIENLNSLNTNIISWCKEMSSKGTGFGKILAGLGTVVSKAIEFASTVCRSTLRSAPWLNTNSIGGFTYGTILGMAITGACVLYVFNKIYKSLRYRFSESLINNNVQTCRTISIRKSILESYITYGKLTKVVESTQLTEGGIIQTINNIIGRAWRMCSEMFNWICSIVVDTTTAIADFTQKHPKLVTTILICIGLVMAYNKFPAVRKALNSIRNTANEAIGAVKDVASTAKS